LIASGGYVDVGRVLLERGADVNAPPVPTSKDTGLENEYLKK
jgi:ankyrin repeat domain-containing protein 17